jgi:hypothetical protein
MREADKNEVMASSGCNPFDALSRSMLSSDKCWTGVIGGRPSFMFGVTPISLLAGAGAPWMLGTDDVLSVRREFLKRTKGYVAQMWLMFPVLKNFVDARNTESIRWLKWIGFEVMESIPYGIHGELFHPFELRF